MIYINDGLKNSMIVLELLRNDERTDNMNIFVEAFHNCREHGFVFKINKMVVKRYEDGKKIGEKEVFMQFDKNVSFCVYEHRNSDEIIINGKQKYFGRSDSLPYMGNKWEYFKEFNFDEYEKVKDWLIEAFTYLALSTICEDKKYSDVSYEKLLCYKMTKNKELETFIRYWRTL